YYRGGNGWYNGHRGYRSYRPGYRRYNDWWFPAGAFVAGAVIGGALSQPTYVERPRVIYRSANYSNAHVRWCYDRYRSYRAYDNTFQPYNGPRQQCWSPYS
ncbi:BA14K family protein, partial [Salmonella enterica subsp. enterica]|nr:BA14K family protein [Salmonella enterica subsp. enterica]